MVNPPASKVELYLRNYQINDKFQEKGRRYYLRISLLEIEKKESKKLRTFRNYSSRLTRVLRKYNRSRQSQSSNGNVYEETEQELGISGNNGTIFK